MNEKLIKELRNQIKQELPKQRFIHTEGVAYTAASLAMRYNFDVESAFIAGLLHDCAKYVEGHKMIKLCDDNNVEVTDFEKTATYLLHAKAGAILAKNQYGINNTDILNSIKYHTTGRPEMSILEKIIFTADYIEPHREPLPNIDIIRETAFNNIDKAIYMITRDTLEHLEKEQRPIDTATIETHLYYKQYA